MPNILVQIGEGIEVAAQDFVKFCDDLKLEAEAVVSPRALIALALLAVPLGKAVASSVAAASQDGINIPLDVQSAQLIVQLWPDLQAYLKTLAIQPIKSQPAVSQP
jgi:hypothetical protein